MLMRSPGTMKAGLGEEPYAMLHNYYEPPAKAVNNLPPDVNLFRSAGASKGRWPPTLTASALPLKNMKT